VRVWTAEGEPTVVRRESRMVKAVAWNPKSNQLATAGTYTGPSTVNIYDVDGRLTRA
jgi:WD40 repeat protein